MMTVPQVRIVRQLAPIALDSDQELRLQLVEINGHPRVSMAVWRRLGNRWAKLPGLIQIPVGLLGELKNRFSAAIG